MNVRVEHSVCIRLNGTIMTSCSMPTFMGLTNGFEIRQSDSLTAGVADDFILFVARSSYQFSSEF